MPSKKGSYDMNNSGKKTGSTRLSTSSSTYQYDSDVEKGEVGGVVDHKKNGSNHVHKQQHKSNKTSTTFGKIQLLLWKNLILRRRQFILTTFELLLPVFFAALIAFMRTFIPGQGGVDNGIVTPYKNNDLNELLLDTRRWRCGVNAEQPNCLIAFAPYGPLTDEIINYVDKFLDWERKPRYDILSFPDEDAILDFNNRLGLKTIRGEERETPSALMTTTESNNNETMSRRHIRYKDYLDGHEDGALKIVIVFEKQLAKYDSWSQLPNKYTFHYKLRIVDKRFKTGELWPFVQAPGPGHSNGHSGYHVGGFSLFQILLDKAFIHFVGHENGAPTETTDFNVSVQGFPYPPYVVEIDFNKIFLFLLPHTLILGFMLIVPSILRNVVSERESGIKELMKMMGLRAHLHWFGWLFDTMLMMFLPIIAIVAFMFLEFSDVSGPFISLENSDPTLWFALFMLYLMSATCFCFAMSTFFKTATLALSGGFVFWLVHYFALAIWMDNNYPLLTLTHKMSAALFPNMALFWAVKIAYRLDKNGIGARWTTLDATLNSLDDLTLGHIIAMLIIDTVLYFVLALYLEQVLPTPHGIRKPWYFPFQKSTWVKTEYKDNSHKYIKSSQMKMQMRRRSSASRRGSLTPFESEDILGGGKNTLPTVKISSLSKKFGSTTAVDSVNLNLYEGQITILLGVNGAGKSSIIHVLTGMCSPSRGTAKILNHDIHNEMEVIRTNLGFCSQHNILFDKLTVLENLQFFGRLKGLTSSEATEESSTLLNKLHFMDKKGTRAIALSGGQKRKLSLGMALISSPKILLLDAPTTGMDTEVRRNIWEILMSLREERTILLTTHSLEEADILGDRVAIMFDGGIQACGSPMFLKNHYKSKATLDMTLEKDAAHPIEILELVRKHIPNAEPKEENKTLDGKVSFSLPEEDVPPPKESDQDTENEDQEEEIHKTRAQRLRSLFSELNECKEDLGIKSIGLPFMTLDDAFEKIVVEKSAQGGNQKRRRSFSQLTAGLSATNRSALPGTDSSTALDDRPSGSVALIFQQFVGIFFKRMAYTKRKRALIVPQLLLPLLLLMACIAVTNKIINPSPPPDPITIDFSLYKTPRTLYMDSEDSQDLGETYNNLVREINPYGTMIKLPVNDTEDYFYDTLVEVGSKDETAYRELYLLAAQLNKSMGHVAWYSTIPYHTNPTSINLITNSVLKDVISSTKKETRKAIHKSYDIKVTNHPLTSGLASILDASTPNPKAPQHLQLVWIILLPIGLATLSASFVIFPLEERMSKAKQLQLMTGISSITFWMASFLWDLLMLSLLISLMLILFPIFQDHSAFTSNGAVGTFILIVFVYGFATISFSYLISLLIGSIAGGFALVTMFHIINGCVHPILVHALEQSNVFETADTWRWVGRMFPTFSAAMCFNRYINTVTFNIRCNMLSAKAREFVCNPNITFDETLDAESFRECCDNCDVFADQGVECFHPQDYIKWTASGESDYIDAGIELQGVGQELVVMLVQGLVYMILLLFIEGSWLVRLRAMLNRTSSSIFKTHNKDPDVQKERNAVDELMSATSGGANPQGLSLQNEALVVHAMSKNFGAFAAVSHMSFRVHHAECFGLLGVNGTGKTTLFQMMTGNLSRSCGNSYISENSLDKNPRTYFRSIGYCPQFDAILEVLSGREILELFCRLRGIPGKHVRAEATKWLTNLDLPADCPCSQYSAGMKRSLSTAIAMIGHPPVVMLDEPTSCVDPVSRRQVWDLVKSLRDHGQSIILTSHSMDECEELVQRLCIMANGEMQCIGTTQYLKAKYSKCFTVTLKFGVNEDIVSEYGVVKRLSETQLQQRLELLKARFADLFQPCELKEKRLNVHQYRVYNLNLGWDGAFNLMEDIKNEFDDVLEDYSISETTLEEVFMEFAKASYAGGRQASVPIHHRALLALGGCL